MLKAYVVGYPTEHSLSPKIFLYLAKKFKKNLLYQAVNKKSFGDFLEQEAKEKDFLGCNITFPLKSQAYEFGRGVNKDHDLLTSVNVMTQKKSKMIFENTDWKGFQLSLSSIPKRVLVLGFGGTTRSVLFALGKIKVHSVHVRARRNIDLTDFSKEFPFTEFVDTAKFQNTTNYNTEIYDLVVNTTPAQAQWTEEFLDFPIDTNTILYDVNYWGNFLLLDRWKNRVHQKNGLSMLIYQAIKTWEIWFEDVIDEKKIHDELYEILRNK